MDPFEAAYNRALKFLSYRQRSEKEVRDNLKKKQTEEIVIEQVITKLREQKFLNDSEFARMWVGSRNRARPRSKRVLVMELRQKGISEEIIESELRDQEFGKSFDLEMAKKIVSKKIDKMRSLERQEIYNKLGGFLARRGFDWETSKRAIDDQLK